MPEQLRLHEVVGQRRAVHGNERSVAARTCGMDGAREELLAGARLAEDERTRVPVAREACGPGQLFAKDRALAHDRGKGRLLRGRRAPRVRRARDRRRDHEGRGQHIAQDLDVVGEREVVRGARMHELHRGAARGVGPDHETGDPRRCAVIIEPLQRDTFLSPRRQDQDRARRVGHDAGPCRPRRERGLHIGGEIRPEALECLGELKDADRGQDRHRATRATRSLGRSGTKSPLRHRVVGPPQNT